MTSASIGWQPTVVMDDQCQYWQQIVIIICSNQHISITRTITNHNSNNKNKKRITIAKSMALTNNNNEL